MINQLRIVRGQISVKQSILIAGLTIVLLWVVLAGPDANDDVAVLDEAAPAVPRTGSALRRSIDSSAAATRTRKWPNVSLDDVLRRNPFAELASGEKTALTVTPPPPAGVPPTSAEPETALAERAGERRRKWEEALSTFRHTKVKLILRTERQASALLGDRLVHEGDVVDGIRIVSIRPNGILVEPALIE